MKNCQQCQTAFEITDADRGFYEKMDVPEPTHCWFCRMIRRLSHRNERFLYHRQCDLTQTPIISSFSKDKPFPVYSMDAWWSDDWDPLTYGQNFDFSRPFFDQFFELRDRVPRIALQQQKPIWNSEYCNCVSRNKNCYLVFSTNYCEDSYYGSWVNYSKNCVDNSYINHCELCYDCVGCKECFNLKYSQDCVNCSDSYFLNRCQGCKNCFGCSNLINKEYCFFNKQLSKEDYEKALSEIDLGGAKTIALIKERIHDELSDLVVKETNQVNNQNCIGDYIRNSKNCHMCFEINDSEDLRYSQCVDRAKLAMDYSYWGQGSEMMYECQACGYEDYNLRFCNLCWSGCTDLTYCDQCFSSKSSFGCVGLKKMEYCILNKQYSKEEYEKLVPKIIEHMKETGEWGEFFPVEKSAYTYNESLAWEQLELDKDEIERRGWPYKALEDRNKPSGTYPIPYDIKEAEEEICGQTLSSDQSGLAFKIIPQEFKFYKENEIPLPRITPDERHWERMKKRNPRQLWDRKCENCQADIKTSYAPNRPEKVYCESCYLKEVY
jgi:hypothetical protein